MTSLLFATKFKSSSCIDQTTLNTTSQRNRKLHCLQTPLLVELTSNYITSTESSALNESPLTQSRYPGPNQGSSECLTKFKCPEFKESSKRTLTVLSMSAFRDGFCESIVFNWRLVFVG